MVKIVNNKYFDLIRQNGNFKTFKTILKHMDPESDSSSMHFTLQAIFIIQKRK